MRAGRPLLVADQMMMIPLDVSGETAYRGAITMPMQVATRPFSQLKVRISSEALMPGKRPGMRFLVRLVHPRTYMADPRVSGVLSEVIVVTTNRAKGRGEGTALLQVKGVQKLPGVGTETARKLLQFEEWKALLNTTGSGQVAERITLAIMKTRSITTV